MKISRTHHKTKSGIIKKNPETTSVIVDNKRYTLNDMRDWFLHTRTFRSVLSFGTGKNSISGEGQSGGRIVTNFARRVENAFVRKLGKEEYISRMDKLMAGAK